MENNLIDVLLATYNGEKYIEAQLYSILSQDYKHWRLLIHDDGSQDKTVEIVKKFTKMDARIYLIDDHVVGLGPGRNFMHLLNYSTAPFICFSDQDDIWFENKISIMLKVLSEKDNTKPQLLCCNFLIWSNGVVISHRLLKLYMLNDILFQNGGIQGCACLFNRKMLELINRKYSCVAMHDHVLALAAAVNHAINYCDIPLFFYRRHASNVTILKRTLIDKLRFRSYVVDKKYYDGIASFYMAFYEELSDKDRKLINLYLTLTKSTFLYRLKSVVVYHFRLHGSSFKLLVKIMICKYAKT